MVRMEQEDKLGLDCDGQRLDDALLALEELTSRVHLLREFIRKESVDQDAVVNGVVIVDPLGVGLELVRLIEKQGFQVILVFSSRWVLDYLGNAFDKEKSVLCKLIKDESLEEEKAVNKLVAEVEQVVKQLGAGFVLEAVITGSETGVLLTDKLSNRLGCKTNGEALSLARRNKALMQDVIREAEIRAIQQKLAHNVEEVRKFYNGLGESAKCVVKPNMSAANESVVLCSSLKEAIDAFRLITGKRDLFGNANQGVLCQEFLEGSEYVVDGVSRDGEFKVVAIWEYEKGRYNGGSFVYFGMKLVDPNSKVAISVMRYAASVVSALSIKYGPSHMEIIVDSSPCLVEVAPRCHNKKGTWLPLIRDCVGYSQLEAVTYSYLNKDLFESLPKVPILKKFGAEVHLVSPMRGKLKSVPGLDILQSLSSYRSSTLPGSGETVKATVDALTRVGTVQLVADSPQQLDQDYRRIRDMQERGEFFEILLQ